MTESSGHDEFCGDALDLAEEVQEKVLADLRAKTEGLPERADAHTEECPGRPGYRGICTCEGDILISRAAVLALIDEALPACRRHRPGRRTMTARDVYVLPLAAVVAGTIVGVGVALYAVDSGLRVLRWAVGR